MQTLTDTLNILTIEDNPSDLFLLEEMLRSSHLKIENFYTTDRVAGAQNILQSYNIDIVLLDLSLPDSFGIDSFLGIQQVTNKIPIIILTGLSDTSLAVEAIKKGAQDYLVKGEFSESLLFKSIQYSLERKRNIEKLHESNERFKIVAKATNDAVWDWNLLTNEVFLVGENYKNLFGYDIVEDFMPLVVWEESIHPDDKNSVLEKLGQFIKDKKEENWEDEYRIIKADGTIAYVYDRGYLMYDANSSPIRMIGATQDITERKKAEEKYRQMFYNNPHAAFLYDPETFRILEVNDATVKKYGYTRSEFYDLSLFDLMREEDVLKLLQYITDRGTSGITKTKLWRHKKKNGENMIVDVTSYLIDYSGKQVRQVLIHDITQRIRLAKELTRQQKLRQQQIAEAVLIAQENEKTTIGQELHDNVNQILIGAKLYLEFIGLDQENRDSHLSHSMQLISDAIEELRRVSKRLIIGNVTEIGLKQSIQEVIENILPVQSFTIDLKTDELDEKLLNANLKITILRIIQEQLNNIIKYAEASSVLIEIKNSASEVNLLISDDGKGFDPGQHRKGVGITNMTNRAQLYNGKVEIDSAPGLGCQVKVTLYPKGKSLNQN